MEGEEENAPFWDGFLEEVTLNGDLRKELERSQERLRGKGEVNNSVVCGREWWVNGGAGGGGAWTGEAGPAQ